MSFASIIGHVNGKDREIVESRVLISAFAEVRDRDTILIHIEPPLSLGPTLTAASNVRIAIYDEREGGDWDVCFTVKWSICEGEFINWGPTLNATQ